VIVKEHPQRGYGLDRGDLWDGKKGGERATSNVRRSPSTKERREGRGLKARRAMISRGKITRKGGKQARKKANAEKKLEWSGCEEAKCGWGRNAEC